MASIRWKWLPPLLLLGAAAWLWWVPPPSVPRLDYSFELLDRHDRVLYRATSRDGYWRLPLDPGRVDPDFIRYLLAYEDQRFQRHPGVDPLALARALGQWVKAGRVVSGASTLTMQTVRLLHPRPRTLASKLVEMAQALKLESRLTKTEVLRLYLTLAPYGGNIQGLRAATLSYFGHEPDHLTLSQAALLIALPQAPEARRPDRHPQAARRARDHVLERLHAKGLISRQALAIALRQPVPRQRRPRPFLAPQLADRLRLAHPGAQRLQTTLDKTLQQRLERLAAHQIWLDQGETIAMLVVDNHSREVRALLGSADYLRHSRLDLTRAVRSPGSTLKPFIYGLGFELGLMHPETRVLDTSYRTGTYAPRNFDDRHHGAVTIRQALQRSLNIPAVKALDKIGVATLVQRLRRLGITLRTPRGKAPDLAIALGGTGLSLHQLVALYAALAQGGDFAPLRILPDDPQPHQRLLSPAAAWQVDDILKEVPPPDGFVNRRAIRFKSGTSYGYRDAWALGYDTDHTIGVWVGHPDGSAGADRTGTATAGPLLFQAFDLLPPPAAAPRPRPRPPLARAEPPAHLRWLDPMPLTTDAQPPLKISFPVDDSTLILRRNSPLILKAAGGRPPYRWLVNGEPLNANGWQPQARWQPDGPGAVTVTLVDGKGAQRKVRLWIDQPPTAQ